MARIKLSELYPVGSELFQDSESFLNELNTEELEEVTGAASFASLISQASASVASQASISGGQITQSIGFTVCVKCQF